jgi:hypothetical protein
MGRLCLKTPGGFGLRPGEKSGGVGGMVQEDRATEVMGVADELRMGADVLVDVGRRVRVGGKEGRCGGDGEVSRLGGHVRVISETAFFPVHFSVPGRHDAGMTLFGPWLSAFIEAGRLARSVGSIERRGSWVWSRHFAPAADRECCPLKTPDPVELIAHRITQQEVMNLEDLIYVEILSGQSRP